MRHKRIIGVLVVVAVLVLLASSASADALISNVPDWNQPSTYGAPVGYGGWCSPTAGSNIMGYWEDVIGCTGLTDRAVMPATIPGGVYPATAGTWQQGLWIDGSIEMGWQMDTGGWRTAGGPFPPNVWGTDLLTIGPGLGLYASSGYVDVGTGIVKVAYPNVSIGKQTTDVRDPNFLPAAIALATMWPVYTAEIDAGRPVECSFTLWVDTMVPILPWDITTFPGETIEEYAWLISGDPHSVVGVGYYDATPAVYNGDEYFICQDGWGSTGQYVRVPVDFHWTQNDYVHDVPEPFTLTLLAMGACLPLLRKKR